MKKSISLFMSLLIVLTLILSTGCGKQEADKSNATTSKDSGTTTVTDLTGRKVEVPKKVKTIVVLGAGGLRMICYAGAQDLVIGVEEAEHTKTLAKGYNYIYFDEFKDLPIVGQGGAGGYTAYDEEIVKLNPDVIIAAYTKELADNLQTKTGIPVVAVAYQGIFDKNFNDSMKLIGKILGREKRCNEIVDYMNKLQKDLNDRTKNVAEKDQPKVYTGACSFAGGHGIEGTYTQFPPFVAINLKSVSDELSTKSGGVVVDKEKIVVWNPDIIFLDPNNIGMVNQDYAKNKNFYKSLKAVKEGKVYTQVAYNWYTTNVETAIIDAYYAGKIIYPEQFKDVDIEKTANEIYTKMLGEKASNYYKDMVNGGLGWRQLTIGE